MIDTVALRLLCWDRDSEPVHSLATLHAPQVRALTTYTTVAAALILPSSTDMLRHSFYHLLRTGGGCIKASIACGNLTPYLCYGAFLIQRWPYSRDFPNAQNKIFLAYSHLLEIRCQEQWTNQKSRYKLKSAVVCQQRPFIACGEAWRNHPQRNVVPILQMRKCMLLYSCSYL